jgi:hypothetical protein
MHPPDKVNILRFIAESPTPLTKRDIVEAFGVKGDDRIEIKRILKELESEGALVKLPGQTYAVPSGLPAVSIIEVTHIDIDGDVFARPVDWNESLLGAPPRIEVTPGDKGHPALREHDRVLAKLHRLSDKKYEARVIRRLDDPRGRVLGGDRGYRPATGPDTAAAAQARREGAERAAHRLGLELDRLRETGVQGHAALARALNHRGVPTPGGGGVWTHTTVSRVLARAAFS